MRLLLGVAEAGFFPGMILYLTYWFPSHRRAAMVAILMAGNPVSGIIGGPFSGFIMRSLHGNTRASPDGNGSSSSRPSPRHPRRHHLPQFVFDDRVLDATWLTPEEKRPSPPRSTPKPAAKTHTTILSVFTQPPRLAHGRHLLRPR
jgi:hypothetical protein